jgi:1-phosphatidylinositol phosphodiesterase
MKENNSFLYFKIFAVYIILFSGIVFATGSKAPQAPSGPSSKPAYIHDGSTSYNQADWMAKLEDSRPLDKISMVGTHESAAFYGGDITQCQSLSLTNQLNMGVRAMDIRTRQYNDQLDIYHGFVSQKKTFESVIQEVASFLQKHPKETVLMRIGSDGNKSEKNKLSYEEAFLDVYRDYSKYFWKGNFFATPTLGQLRGKIVILQKFGGSYYGMDYDKLKIQDSYTMNTNWDLYSKWEKVKKHIDDAAISGGGKGIYMNYLTASTGSMPYFVVSGQSSPQTNAPLLATGKTTPGWASCCPDFPRVNCLGKLCTIAFLGTNPLSVNYIKSKFGVKKGYIGIMMTDFPGPGLVEAVINLN